MHLFDVFERLIVISLPYRTDRRREMVVQFARLGLSMKDSRITLFDAIRPEEAGGFASVGARGCFESHLAALRLCSEARSVLILEDDTDFAPDIPKLLAAAMSALPADWSIFYGGGYGLPASRGGAVTNAPAAIGITEAHFIGFNGGAIRRAAVCLEAIRSREPGDPRGGPMHVDGAYGHFRAANTDLQTWVATPALGHQRASRTDIHELRWFDRWMFIKGVAGLLRKAARR